MIEKKINISIISHNQANIIKDLLHDLEKFDFYNEILITINCEENIEELKKFHKLPITFITNNKVKGFGENHNNAFKYKSCDYFLIINPDVRILNINFNNFFKYFDNANIKLISPIAVDKYNNVQDSARKFPSPITPILRRISFFRENKYLDSLNYNEVDWVSGMFMMINSEFFKKVGMFDEKFFMYYEDVDLCKRIKKFNGKILRINTEKVLHKGQHQSHKSLKYLLIHLKSMAYYHFKYFL